jgi:hypothetical protein
MTSFEKRKYGRRYIVATLEYVLDPLIADEIYDGVIADISDSGLCILTTDRLMEGQAIKLKNALPLSSQSATVRWSERYNNLYYRAGLELV